MPWQVSLIILYFVAVGLNLTRKVYSSKSSFTDKSGPAISYIICVVPLGILVGLGTGNVRINWSMYTIVSLVLMAICIGLYNVYSFKSAKNLSVAAFLTIIQIAYVTAIILGSFLLDEGLTKNQVIGSIFLISGAVLAAQSYQSKQQIKFRKSAAFVAVIASIFLGAGVVAERAAIQEMSIGAYFIFGYMLQAISLMVIALKDLDISKIRKASKNDWMGAFAYGLFSALYGFFFIYTVNEAGNVSLVSSLVTLQLPLSALAGYVFLKEREVAWKLIAGLFVSFAGLLIIAIL